MEKDAIEATILHAFEVSLEAQLRAVKRLRAGPPAPRAARKSTSQISMVQDVLRRAVNRGDRFVRTDKNVFALKGAE